MQRGSMLIYHCCRLRAAVAIGAVEIKSGDAMFAEAAFECGAAIQRFGCVISHIFYCSPSTYLSLGQKVCNLRDRKVVTGKKFCCGEQLVVQNDIEEQLWICHPPSNPREYSEIVLAGSWPAD
jgi:hypothetical protein